MITLINPFTNSFRVPNFMIITLGDPSPAFRLRMTSGHFQITIFIRSSYIVDRTSPSPSVLSLDCHIFHCLLSTVCLFLPNIQPSNRCCASAHLRQNFILARSRRSEAKEDARLRLYRLIALCAAVIIFSPSLYLATVLLLTLIPFS